MRYLRIWRRFFVMALMELMEYRTGFTLSVLEGMGQLALLVVMYLVFYRFTDEIAGWTEAEALLLLGIFWTFDGVWGFQFADGIGRLPSLIRKGDLDFLLLRPVQSQFLVTCWRGIGMRAPTKIASGVFVVVYAGNAAGVQWSATAIAEAGAFALCGLAILYGLRFALSTLCFWVLQISELYELSHNLYTTARFPVTYFGEPVRSVLTCVIPAAFVSTFPAQALLGTVEHGWLPVGLVLAAGALAGTHLLWIRAVRHYSSASS
ncbi:MAG: ABC-2 family transporter protein [Chloroflexi bacterium]|nr:ABC-2 family transporter protein [Chloroflexota bacterium]